MRLGPNSLSCPRSGEHVEILHRPDEHGDHAEFLITLAGVGSGPGPHAHPGRVERFQVVRGALQVSAGSQTIGVPAGQEVTVAAGTGHSFRALEPGTQLLGRLTPGHGFEAGLEDVFALFDRGELGPDGPIDRVAFEACFERHKHVMVSMRPKLGPPGQA